MFKAFKEHCERPITWGKYYKLCGGCMLLSMAVTAAMMYRIQKSFNELDESYGSEEDEAE